MKLFGKLLLVGVLCIALLLGGLWFIQRNINRGLEGSVETISAASLQGLREQARLTAFVARFVAVVTSRQSRFGLNAERTMIMPGLVRYEMDLNRISQKDMVWNPATGTLTIILPPLILTGPEIDIAATREYDGGGLLLTLTDARQTLDAANQKAAQTELLKQARAEVPMRLARDASRNAIERSFAMPLRAAGLKATVVAKFAS